MTRDRSDPFGLVERDREIAAVRGRLARLESERLELQVNLNRLLSDQETWDSPASAADSPVTNASSPAAKIALFRSLFRGRDDVFPKRWENRKTGRAGYAPACANEWAPRICGKPRVRCGACPHHAFLYVTDDVIDGHLRGYHTVGGARPKQRRAAMQRLSDVSATDERVLIATGRYIGEGFDDARLDSLFLAMPISWKGTLAQYVGRLHRSYPAKREVIVYDYVDEAVPVLKRMSEKRVRGYKSLGYSIDAYASSSDASEMLPMPLSLDL